MPLVAIFYNEKGRQCRRPDPYRLLNTFPVFESTRSSHVQVRQLMASLGETFEKVAHDAAICVVRAAGALADIRSPITGKRRTSVV